MKTCIFSHLKNDWYILYSVVSSCINNPNKVFNTFMKYDGDESDKNNDNNNNNM